MFFVTVPVRYDLHDNDEHPEVAELAQQHGMEHDGGAIGFVGPSPGYFYEHEYVNNDEEKARAFTVALRNLGFWPYFNPGSPG